MANLILARTCGQSFDLRVAEQPPLTLTVVRNDPLVLLSSEGVRYNCPAEINLGGHDVEIVKGDKPYRVIIRAPLEVSVARDNMRRGS